MARWKEDVTGDVPEAKELKEIRGKCVKQREKQTLNQSVPNTSISVTTAAKGGHLRTLRGCVRDNADAPKNIHDGTVKETFWAIPHETLEHRECQSGT